MDGINKTAQSWAVGGTGTRPGEDTDNAKYWAQQAQASVGGDFATKTEAQGYVTAHNESDAAHSDIREALEGKAAGSHASQHGKDGADPITPAAIGAASLDADGKVPASQLPETDTYTKDEILKDATAAKFGKDTGAVPDEVLDVLSAGILHKPAKTKTAWEDLIKADFSLSDNVTTAIDARYAHGKFWIFKQTNVLTSEDGKNWESHPLSLSNNYGYAVCETPTGFALFDVAGTTKQVYFTTDFSDLDGPYSMGFTMTQNTPWCVIYSTLHNGFFATGETTSGYGRIFFSQDAKTWQQIATDNIMSPIGFVIADNGKVYLAIFTNNTKTYLNVAEITPSSITYSSGGLSPGSYTGAYPYVLTYYNGAIYMILNGGIIKYDIDATKITSAAVPSFSRYSIQEISVANFVHKNKIASLFYFSSSVKLIRNEQLDNMAAADWVDTGITLSGTFGSNAALAVNNDFSEAVIVSVAANDSQGVYYSADVYGPVALLTDVLGNMVNIPLKQIAGAASIEIGTYKGTGTKNVSLKTNGRPRLIMIFREQNGANYYPIFCIALLPDKDVTSTETYWIPNFSFASNNGETISGYPLVLEGLNATSLLLRSVSHDIQYALNASGVTYRYLLMYMDD